MKFELTVLGTSAAVPYRDRHLAAQVLNIQEQLFLIDCGEGTQFQMMKFHVKKMKINQVFISHLHGDHFFGLFGVLTSMAMMGRKNALDIYAPAGLEEIVKVVFQNSFYESPFPIHFFTLETEQEVAPILIFENAQVEVFSFPLKHRVPTVGFLFKEKPRSRNIIADKIKQFNIPFQAIKAIKNGSDYVYTEVSNPENSAGVIIPNSELTIDPPKPRSFAYCSDTAYSETVIEAVKNVDLLYHEATFGHEMAAHASITGHSTASEAGTVALKSQAKKLIIGHFSSRYEQLDPLLDEAKTVFPNTVLGIDGRTYFVDSEKVTE
jgi:ribonuclease Z